MPQHDLHSKNFPAEQEGTCLSLCLPGFYRKAFDGRCEECDPQCKECSDYIYFDNRDKYLKDNSSLDDSKAYLYHSYCKKCNQTDKTGQPLYYHTHSGQCVNTCTGFRENAVVEGGKRYCLVCRSERCAECEILNTTRCLKCFGSYVLQDGYCAYWTETESFMFFMMVVTSIATVILIVVVLLSAYALVRMKKKTDAKKKRLKGARRWGVNLDLVKFNQMDEKQLVDDNGEAVRLTDNRQRMGVPAFPRVSFLDFQFLGFCFVLIIFFGD